MRRMLGLVIGLSLMRASVCSANILSPCSGLAQTLDCLTPPPALELICYESGLKSDGLTMVCLAVDGSTRILVTPSFVSFYEGISHGRSLPDVYGPMPAK